MKLTLGAIAHSAWNAGAGRAKFLIDLFCPFLGQRMEQLSYRQELDPGR